MYRRPKGQLMVLNYILGVVAALSAPLIMTIGFYIWDGLWSGSSLGLNIFKGTLATVIFLIIIGIINLASNQIYFQHQGTNEDIGWIVLSAFIGITIGDTCWLQSMAMIGAIPQAEHWAIRPLLTPDIPYAMLTCGLKYLGRVTVNVMVDRQLVSFG